MFECTDVKAAQQAYMNFGLECFLEKIVRHFSAWLAKKLGNSAPIRLEDIDPKELAGRPLKHLRIKLQLSLTLKRNL